MSLRRIIKILSVFLISLIGIILLVFVSVNLPFSHRFITGKVNRIFYNSGIPIHITSVERILPTSILIQGFGLYDTGGDTIICAETIKASFVLSALTVRKIIIPSVYIGNATVKLERNTVSREFNIAGAFQQSDKAGTEKPAENNESWEVSIGKAELSAINFQMTDSVSGIYIHQHVKDIKVIMDKMSLLSKTMLIQSLDINGAAGSIKMESNTTDEKSDGSFAWNLGLRHLSLNDFNLVYHELRKKVLLKLSLGEAVIKVNKVDVNHKIFDISGISLDQTSTTLLTSHLPLKENNSIRETTGKMPLHLKIKRVDLTDVSFLQADYEKTGPSPVVPEIHVTGIRTRLSDIEFDPDKTTLVIKRLAFDVNNGFSVMNMKGELDSHSGKTQIKIALKTGNSKIQADGNVHGNVADLINNPGKISMASITIRNTEISLKDLICFKPDLQKNPDFASLSGKPLKIKGTIDQNGTVTGFSDMEVSQDNNFNISLRGSIENLYSPATMTGTLQFNISDVGISWLKEIISGAGIENRIPDFKKITAEGLVSNSIHSPVFNIKFNSDLGNIGLHGSVDFDRKIYSLKSSFDKLMLGIILDQPKLGSFSGSGEINGSGFDRETFAANLVLLVDSFGFNHYNYTKTRIDGDLRASELDLSLLVNDPSLDCNLKAIVTPADSIMTVRASSNFKARLNDLHLYDDTLSVEGSFTAIFHKKENSMASDILISDLNLITPKVNTMIHQIAASFGSDSLETKLTGESDFFTLAMKIERPLSELGTIIPGYRNYVESFFDTSRLDEGIRVTCLPDMTAKMKIGYHNVLKVFIPDTGLHFTQVDVDFINNISENRLNYSIRGSGIGYKTAVLGNLNAILIDSAGIMNLKVDVNDGSMAGRPVNKLQLAGHFANRMGNIKLDMLGKQNEIEYSFELYAVIENNTIVLTIPSKQLIMNGVQWQMHAPHVLSYNPTKKIILSALNLYTKDSFLEFMSGSEEGQQVYQVEFNNVSLVSLFRDDLIPGKPAGSIMGSVNYRTADGTGMKTRVDLNIRNGRWSDVNFNTLRLKGTYSTDNQSDYNIDMVAMLDSSKISVKGEKPVGGSRSLYADFVLLPVATFQPFVKNLVSDLGGTVSGNFNIASGEGNENFNGVLTFDEARLRITSLNSGYKIPGEKVLFTGKRMLFNQFRILDSLDHELFVDGWLDFSNPAVITSDLDITSSNLQVMNTSEKENSSFYGNVFIDSRLTVKGPFTSPVLKGNILLSGGTEIFYRQMEDLSLSESERVVSFENPASPGESSVKPLKAGKGLYNKTSVETIVEINPTTRIHFNLSKRLYDIGLMIKGGGILNYTMPANDQINISGKYEVREGTADLKMIGWPNKTFRITEGGFISWDGRIDDPELKFEAVNRVRSSYINPVDGKERDVDFNVTLMLSNRLSELDVLFTMVTPDQYLMSIINTLSPEEKMRQAITILLFEKIDLPGISTTSNYMNEQVNQMLENQLNQLTKTTIKDIDISFGLDSYTTATQSGGEETKTSLSYEVKKNILNNRAQIEFSGRLNDFSNQQSTKDVSLNNFSFEYRLDSSATKFLKAYNEHSYEDIFEGEIVKTGVGFIYKKSYDSFRDIWMRDQKKKKTKNRDK
jgi:translocation and assembly module TamB